MLWMAITTPALGSAYLVWQIHKRDLRGWQHYACLTSLVFLISILCLVGSGKVESFGFAGNTVRVVDAKLEEIKRLTEQNKRIAKATATLVHAATRMLKLNEEYNSQLTTDAIASLLKEAGLSSNEIKNFLKEMDRVTTPNNQKDQ